MKRRNFLIGSCAAATFPTMASAHRPPIYHHDHGGKLRIGVGAGSTTDSLDPTSFSNDFSHYLAYAQHTFLTQIDTNGRIIGDLALEWETSFDARTWTFKIRQTQFHNGKMVKASDVVLSYYHHLTDDSRSSVKALLSSIKDIRAPEDSIVVFELESGNADFPYLVSDHHLPILPSQSNGTVDWQSGIGAGAFILKNYEPGMRADLVYFSGHWHGKNFDNIEILSILDATARMNAVINDEVDVIDQVEPRTVRSLQQTPNLIVESSTSNFHYTFPMRTNISPFDNLDFRYAMKYAINRQEMLDKILLGFGNIGNDIPIGVNQRYFNSELPQREFDPDKAAFHYKRSGHSGAIQLSVSDAAYTGATDAAQLFSASAIQAGINIDVVQEPEDGYWSNVWNKKPFATSSWNGRPTEDWIFSTAYQSEAKWNETAWVNERFDNLLIAARAELDEQKRRSTYFEMQALLYEDGGLICPMFSSNICARSRKLNIPQEQAANGPLSGYRATTRWWFG